MKITTLIENLVYQPGLTSEHGLSIYLDTGERRILFDTGQSDAFISNANLLGIDISAVDALVISHGHFDHTGGLIAFLNINNHAPVYIKKEAFNKKLNSSGKFIGTPELTGRYLNRLHFIDEVLEIDHGVFVVPHIPIVEERDTSFKYFFTITDGHQKIDFFEDELFLAVVNDNKLSVFSSCSHRGITNIMMQAQKLFNYPVFLVSGGFHLKNAQPEQLNAVINYFRNNKPEYLGICHCTGIENFPRLSLESGTKVFYNYTGNIIKI